MTDHELRVAIAAVRQNAAVPFTGDTRANFLALNAGKLADHVEAQLKEKAGETCGHGVPDGDWCKPCNDEQRRAAAEHLDEHG
jgi:hypothetical protein